MFSINNCVFIKRYFLIKISFTQRKQYTIYPEGRINAQAANAYEKFKSKAKLIESGIQLEQIKEIGKKIEDAVSAYFLKEKLEDPTQDFDWDYVLVKNDKVKNSLLELSKYFKK